MKRAHDASARDDGSRESLVAEAVDEFRERCARGEQLDAAEYAARFPQVADELRRLLPALVALDAAGLDSDDGTPSALGDFRIQREVGRGGMAVVYEAEQLSLGRRVALKVLPFAAVMDPRQLQRFKNEAQAAAHLHHGHIVPVHSVGCERGVHYYAMQYIEGMSVAQMIEELGVVAGRDMPAESSSAAVEAITKGKSTRSAAYCRAVARLGIQAAEALDHAHQQGVVHRDIKPANLLVDAAGHLWITDFGLACFASQPGLTMTGDILGTLRYMSPEQGEGRQAPANPQTDIYSLGVTLYELLTLEMAFPGDDPRRVIQEIAVREPPPARRFNPAIPADLETILAKAMAKDAAERFATAQDLADDLTRFLKHEPIHARRPTLAQRAKKWARRHAALVWGVAAVLTLAVAGLSTGTTLLWQEQARTREAYEALSRQQQRTEKAYEAEASQRARAETNLALALEALDKVYLDEAEIAPRLRPNLSRDLLTKGLGFYERFAAENREDPKGRLRVGVALYRAGWIHRALGSEEEAQRAFQAMVAVNRELLEEDPDHAEAHVNLGNALGAMGEQEEAIDEYKKAIGLDPNSAVPHYNLGNVLQGRGDLEGAAIAYRAAIDLRADLAEARVNLGNVLLKLGSTDAALEEYEKAVDLRPDLVEARINLGCLLAEKGDLDGAITQFRAAIQLAPGLPGAHYALGKALAVKGEREEALERLRRALQLESGNEVFRTTLARACYNFANGCLGKGKVEAATKLYEESVQLVPDFAPAQSNLGVAYWKAKRIGDAATAWAKAVELSPADALGRQNLGLALLEMKRFDEAIVHFKKALRLQPGLRQAQYNLARSLAARGSYKEAIAAYRKAIEVRHANAPGGLARLLATCPDAKLRNPAEALALAKQAVEIAPKNRAARSALGIAQYRVGEYAQCVETLQDSRGVTEHLFTAMALWRLEKRDEARALYDEMCAWIEKNAPEDPELERFRAEAAELMGAKKD